MAYKTYTFKEENEKRYKGVKYYRFNDEYIILAPDGTEHKRFSLKDTKKCINDILVSYKNGWVE
jgi:hypothetical protein